MTNEEFERWPKCAISACRNKSCLRLRSKYCWPHTPGGAADARQNLRETESIASSQATQETQHAN